LILGFGVPEHSRRLDAWQGLRQKLDALFGKVQLLQVKAGHVAARPGEALHLA